MDLTGKKYEVNIIIMHVQQDLYELKGLNALSSKLNVDQCFVQVILM